MMCNVAIARNIALCIKLVTTNFGIFSDNGRP